MNRLQSVDVVRVAAILAVIAIHTTPFSSPSVTLGENMDLATVINQAARFAVPFFFVLSGYFWGRKIATGASVKATTLPVLKRTALLFLFWSTIYLFPTDLFTALERGASGPFKGIYWNIQSAMGRPVEILFAGTMSHLWFLPALVCSMAISALFLHFGQGVWLIAIAVVLFLTGLAGGSYRDAPFGFEASFNFRNGPFFSLPLFVTGYFLAYRSASKAWLPAGLLIALLGACLHFYEIVTLNQMWSVSMVQDYVLGTYFFGLGVSMVAISNARLLQCARAAAIGPLVLGIYASHMIFVEFLQPIEKMFEGSAIWSLSFVALVFMLSYALTRCLARFSATRRFVM